MKDRMFWFKERQWKMGSLNGIMERNILLKDNEIYTPWVKKEIK